MSDYGKLFSTEHVDRGRWDAATSAADEEIATDPFDPEPLFNRGRALLALERFDEGIAALERAATLDASGSGMDAWHLDDVTFEALRALAARVAEEDVARATAILRRYLVTYPEGRHVADIAKWEQHFGGVVKTWVKESE